MALEDSQDFMRLVAVFSPSVQETAVWLREFIWKRYPESNELIYGKSRGLAVGWGFTDKAGDIFVSFACYSKHVNLGFHHVNLLDDPKGLLEGSGNQYRHFKMGKIEDFPHAYMETLMDAAWMNVHSALKPKAKLSQGLTIVKSMPPSS